MADSKCEKRSQPVWSPPTNTDTVELKLYNSLTRQKEKFVPQNGKRVLWYSCGPTVYDVSHMGHARSYISFDILRRVLSDYFSYDVFYVMNITDIDDKIIKRARQQYLLQQYIEQNHPLSMITEDIKSALDCFKEQACSTTDVDKKSMMDRIITATNSALNACNTVTISDDCLGVEQHNVKQSIIEKSKDVLCDWLDSKYGSQVTDNSIFSSLPAKYEELFYEDMGALNVMPPTVVARVSEFIPEIIDYIKVIITNDMAYEANGSVYFDTVKFDKVDGHFYGKLVPEAFGDLKSLHEGEGDLSISEDKLTEKRNPSDFAVWKASKRGEPSWDSPWGKGRPGWHIECSVLASIHIGCSIDIHTGGFDLKFPHHDNELAQAEAYYDNDYWVRYFLHSGHLTISGCKMSKSLKNFITIKDALKNYSSSNLRFVFLLHSWKDTLDYSEKTMDMAIQYEKMVNEFHLNVKDAVRCAVVASEKCSFIKWGEEETRLNESFHVFQADIHAALCDNIDTRKTLDHIRDLITSCNIYMRVKKSSSAVCDRLLLQSISDYIFRLLKIFGIKEQALGFSQSSSCGKSLEEEVLPYLTALANFREQVRQSAREIKAPNILKLCDELRDDVLPNLGVRLEDEGGTTPAIKLVNKDILLKERALKLKIEEEKRLEKERKKKLQEEAAAAKNASNSIPHWEMFKSEGDKYSKFDEKGIPTHDAEGKELTKSQLKKLQKAYLTQEKKYKAYVNSLQNGEVPET